MEKKKIVKDYDKLPPEVLEKLRQMYPNGYSKNLISYFNAEGLRVSALPFETEEYYYLIRMSVAEAKKIDEEDDLDFGFKDPDAPGEVSMEDVDQDNLFSIQEPEEEE
ncbi:MAG TPA: hypothetical protein P5050_09095 [Bacteroidia bacterium]|nr:hypothetical protein [Sphingobacteriales bacterium]HPD65734.1 hypothetical protein [Bacteroidia bacterium]HRS59363.1 hypothetical protein [Bacteroidia bacterium]HRU69060.1 hypothetical protein [Bacteroidia bacterium]